MKRILIILSLFIVGCSVFGDEASYNITFDPPTEGDVVKMYIYRWEGKDTTICPFYEGIPLDPTSTFLSTTITTIDIYNGAAKFIATADGDTTWISIVAQYEDSAGNRSNTTWATADNPGVTTTGHFLICKDVRVSNPKNVKISH